MHATTFPAISQGTKKLAIIALSPMTSEADDKNFAESLHLLQVI